MKIKQAYKNDVETLKNTVGYEFINYIRTPYYDSSRFGTTKNGVTYTLNKNKSLMLNGTATSDDYFHLIHRFNETFILPKGKYIFNGLDDTAPSQARLCISSTIDNNRNVIAYIKPNEEQYFELLEDTQVGVNIEYVSGTRFNNTIIRPMIRPSYVIDKTYKQYREQLNSFNTKHQFITLHQTADTPNQPWQEIKNQWNKFDNTVYTGLISCGAVYTFYGFKVWDTYGSFIIINYGTIYFVSVNNGSWTYYTVPRENTKTF